jgi:hypothetical protein
MALFAQECLNPGVAKREVFGWAMYDFANSGYTTVVLTAVFNAYFVGVVAGGAAWATLAWTLALGASNALVMLTMPMPSAPLPMPVRPRSACCCFHRWAAWPPPPAGRVGPGDLCWRSWPWCCRTSATPTASR